jgi:hypothetical protein
LGGIGHLIKGRRSSPHIDVQAMCVDDSRLSTPIK